jgi:hypothetical protein
MDRESIKPCFDIVFPDAVREEYLHIAPPPDEVVDASWTRMKKKLEVKRTYDSKENGVYGVL